jgi:hypothetical protein
MQYKCSEDLRQCRLPTVSKVAIYLVQFMRYILLLYARMLNDDEFTKDYVT